MAFSHKIYRYTCLIRDFKNWLPFLAFKSSKSKSFKFEMRNGFKIEVTRSMLPPFKESFFDGVYLKHFPKGSLPTSPLIIDVGANVGFFSLAMYAKFPQAKIIAFEPMPFNYRQLEQYKNVYEDFDWKIENKAIADDNNGLTLYSSNVDGFSTMAGVFASEKRGESIEVLTLTLAEVIKEHALQNIDLLKLDCEGSEYAILYGLSDENFKKISLLSIESHPGSSTKQHHGALVSFLKTKSYQTEDQLNADGTGYIWAWR